METFRTVLPTPRAPFALSHADEVMLVGSCFTEHIGARLSTSKFRTLTNPFGIVYNPLSMVAALQRLWAADRPFTAADLFENAGLWHSWQHHGHFSHPEREIALQGINRAYQEAALFLRRTNRLLLTFGTADVFSLRANGEVVANNHKMPAALLDERRLSIREMVDAVLGILGKIKTAQPDLQVILTVSPVRHLRHGLIENQRSKATLLLACAQICQDIDYAHYFPAYELLLDDLRDYRFYGSDMIHPSETAVQYIWRYFGETYFSETTQKLNAQLEKIATAMRHRPFHPTSPAYQVFKNTQLQTIEQLQAEHAELDFSAERAWFGSAS